MDPIIIDDFPENTDDIIDLDNNNDDDVEVIAIDDLHKLGCYDDIIKENKLLGEFIDKCLEIENSHTMTRVINRSLIPTYQRTSKEFRQSNAFHSLMSRALCNIQVYPEWKFSHVKKLCDSLKLNSNKRRLVLKGSRLKELRSKVDSSQTKRKRIEIIDTDEESDGYEVPLINLDEYMKDTFDCSLNKHNQRDIHSSPVEERTCKEDNSCFKISDDEIVSDNVECVEIIETDSEKENETGNVEISTATSKKKHSDNDSDEKLTNNYTNSHIPTVCVSDDEITEITDNAIEKPETDAKDVENLLVPQKIEVFAGRDEATLLEKITTIEKEICKNKNIVNKLEMMEVESDNVHSSYIQCERYKAKIVSLYHQLCELTGEKPIKRREVRLKATEGKPSLPLQKLEQFINSKIGNDGLPHFPDFHDVVECVREANHSGGLGWSKQRVLDEARALFTFCGQALQKNRQRREWRDMLELVKSELIEDPADGDPELMARLQANRKKGISKETELLDRYSEMNDLEATEENFDDSEEETNSETPAQKKPIARVRIAPTSVPFIRLTQRMNRVPTEVRFVDKIESNICKSTRDKHANSLVTHLRNDNVLSQVATTPTLATVKEKCKDDNKNNITNSTCTKDIEKVMSHVIEHCLRAKVVLTRMPITFISTKVSNSTLENTDSARVSYSAVENTDSINVSSSIVQNTDDTKRVKTSVEYTNNIETKISHQEETHQNGEVEIKIKEEPWVDIQKELEEFGDNFTTTVFDIQDPFVVVEITSDSSTDDEDDTTKSFDL